MTFDPTVLATAAVGVVVGVVSTYVALRRDHREQRAAALSEARETIELLREQTDILKAQAESREDEWRRLEGGWRSREERMEERISDLERDYRSLVLTVTSMGLCADAQTCPNYNPGDRRARRPPHQADVVKMYCRQTSGGNLTMTANDYAPRLAATWLRQAT